MSRFTEFTSIQPIPKSNLWTTTKWLYWELWEEGSNEFIGVPPWFIFDGATIPLIITMLTGMQRIDAQTITWATLHDYWRKEKIVPIYNHINWEYVKIRMQRFSRLEWDIMYLQAILACSTSKLKAYTQYYWIRLAGYPIRAWRIHTT